MNILSIENLEKTLNEIPLFQRVNLGLSEGEKVGIVGKNGAGKSTFLRIIAGALAPDEGKISVKRELNISFLEQSVSYNEDTTVNSFLYLSSSAKIALLKEYHNALRDEDLRLSARLLERIEKENLFDIERSYRAILTELKEELDGERLMSTLSGGESKKVAIARALATKPELLLLDEPTNHLDIPTIEYLESWIKRSKAACIIVTHDRHILNECCSTIWELDRGTFYSHPGSFSAYLERKEERLLMNEKEQARLKTILRRELEWLKRGPKARTGKDKNRKERIEEMQSSLRTVREAKGRDFSSSERRLGKKILEISNITKSYGNETLFTPFSFSFKKGDKIALVGNNGVGKSTLLDILTGRISPDSGSVDIGVNTLFGYYDQSGRELVSSKTVLEYAENLGKRVTLSDGEEVSTSRFLELFGFSTQAQRSPISVLSGGEKRRLYLITRIVLNPNFLILDEPTNDLDIETMENLESYIRSFPGCVLLTSHDRTFLDMTTDTTLYLNNREIKLLPGSYSEIEELFKDEERDKGETKANSQLKERSRKKGLTFSENREKVSIESEIEEKEALIKELENSFSSLESDKHGSLNERVRLYEEAKKRLDEITDRYLELLEKES